MPIDSIKNRHYLILGGSSGMGFATAGYLLRGDAVVTIGGRTTERLASAQEQLLRETGVAPERLRSIPVDATEPESVEAAVARAANPAGKLDGIFVVAGVGDFANVWETTPEFMREQITGNVGPLVNAIASGFSRMKDDGGSIVAMSSAAALCSYPKLVGYGASKAALDHYVRAAADELGQYKIRINAVRSGFTKSGASAGLLEDEAYVREFERITPLGPYGQAEDFGPMVSLLLSPESSWITGQIVTIDGGLSLRGYGGGVFPAGMFG
jgi:NAD(P)-dependent dehydrogenase (short-subunit alcohol dehydrogenase family)